MGDGQPALDLSGLPSVERLAAALDAPHAEAVSAAREVIAQRRTQLRSGAALPLEPDLLALARARLEGARRSSLRRVLNATGVILHTNLGRAPLAAPARAAVARAAEGYGNLELDLASGERSPRQDHVDGLLRELTGGEAALVVNNCAGATLLAATALAGPGSEVVVSRGQLVEIGGGFRIPEVIAVSGSRLVEVGTTNRTRLEDYEHALGPDTGAILRAHPSNFRQLGFVAEVAIEVLCGLGVPVIDDVGSGVLAEGMAVLDEEPPVRRSVAAGAAVVCFSGDKLLGGPQAGVLVGRAETVDAAARHPLARALRIDKISLAGLEATLRLYRDPARARREIPVLAALDADEGELVARAERLGAGVPGAEVVRASAKVGGGALPLLELEGPAVALAPTDPERLARLLRAGEPPVVGRVREGRLLLDPRTLTDEEADLAAAAARRALGAGAA